MVLLGSTSHGLILTCATLSEKIKPIQFLEGIKILVSQTLHLLKLENNDKIETPYQILFCFRFDLVRQDVNYPERRYEIGGIRLV